MEATDLFSQILDMEMTQENAIPESDTDFCKALQEDLDETLRKLKEWYEQLDKEAETMGHDYMISRFDDGRISGYQRSSRNSIGKLFRFEPFEAMTSLAKQYKTACRYFRNHIIGHFNEKYQIDVKTHTEYDEDDFCINGQDSPKWEDTVQEVITHLGGRTFRETAEEEIISTLHKDVTGYRGQMYMKLNGKTITLNRLMYYSDYWPCQMQYDSARLLDRIMKGLLLGVINSINGNYGYIKEFDHDKVAFGVWYDTITEAIEGVKFYKNGKVDFRFKDAKTAENCWKRLRLDTIPNHES